MEIPLEAFTTITVAILVVFVGRSLVRHYKFLQKLSIPDPLPGGLLCAVVVTVLAAWWNIRITFETGAIDYFLVYFFAAIGLRARLGDLISGGKPLVFLVVISTIFILLQNFVGMATAVAYGFDPKVGLLSGSISLTGGVGTTLAWAPILQEKFGIANAKELGIACNTVGIVAACVIGGPIAQYLMKRHRLQGSSDSNLEVGEVYQDGGDTHTLSYYDVLGAVFMTNVTIFLGYTFFLALKESGVTIPVFVPVLMAGILINNLGRLFFKNYDNIGRERGTAMISDISLGIFLSIALMSMDLMSVWQTLRFVTVVMTLQIALAIIFATFIIFHFMGKDYDAAVVSSGFGGIALGSTATAVLNMTAVTRQYGASHKAFIIVPLTCGFFIDLTNTLIITNMLKL